MPKKFETLASIVEQLESCDFESEGGPLKLNGAFMSLKEMAHDSYAKTPDEVRDVCALLRSTLAQQAPSDDKIIMDNIRDAYHALGGRVG